ncbi:MAG: 2-hydroxyacid dehydrogenase [Bacteroidales bacterium]|nr:2-hydroxyacid dehydrogenase [Bacteroidales bacterium]
MKIAVFNTKSYDREYLDAANNSKHELKYLKPELTSDTAGLAKGYDGICAFVNDNIDRDTIQALSDLNIKLIALRCAGFNQVDLEAAQEKKITVLRVPAYSPQAVAEHAVALIMALNRKTHKAYNRVREGNFSLERLMGFDVHNKIIGVIGTGRIGLGFINIMMGFGCEILAFDHHPNEDLIKRGVKYVTLPELFNQSDIVSLHCPLTPETYHLINKNTLNQMKKGAMLINTSRGKLINSEDVIDALKSEQLGYLGIDVYSQEENLFFKDLSEQIIFDDTIMRLITFPNVLITSHQAFFTTDALTQIAQTTIQNISDFEMGIQSKNEINATMVKR